MEATVSRLQPPIVMRQPALTINMTHAAGQATPNDSPVLHAAIGLAEQIREVEQRDRTGPPASSGYRRRNGRWIFTLTAAAYNLVRLPKLLGAAT